METRKKVGLALGSGSARGFSHIGVIRVLEAEGIPIDCIAGTSIGAIVGAVYASGMLPKGEEFLKDFDWKDMTALLDPLFPVSGLLGGKRIEKLLRSFLGNRHIEDFPLSFAAVAADVASGEEVVFTHGDAVKAIRASMSMPGIFAPVFLENRFLVDGGLVSPVPVEVARRLGADVVIAVNLAPEMAKRSYISLDEQLQKSSSQAKERGIGEAVGDVEKEKSAMPDFLKETIEKGRSFVEEQTQVVEQWIDEKVEKGKDVLSEKNSFLGEWIMKKENPAGLPDIFSVLFNSINIMQDHIAKSSLRHYPPEILLNPDLAKVRLLDFGEIDQCIHEGERVAREALSAIKETLNVE
ncbi:MAG: patatin family protein [bacterium]|nr:patatin family protein [bacterium]